MVDQALPVGDYGAVHDEQQDQTIFERKSISDLFSSFTADRYEAERSKIIRAKDLGLHYILAVEGTASDILRGHSYWHDGELRESKKSGISQLRQIYTICRKYHIEAWFCPDRKLMALQILEYFLAHERVKPDPTSGAPGGD